MELLDAFLLDAASLNLWIAARTDGVVGTGTAQDPYNGTTRQTKPIAITLSYLDDALQEARVSTAPFAHSFVAGDVVTISGVTGPFATNWNGTFGIYEISEFGFRYFMKKAVPPAQPVPGSPQCVRLTFPFDEIMRNAPEKIKMHIGPGVFQTRGFAVGDDRGWQPKTGQKIIGAGFDVTVLQLLGADLPDQHYHVVGMNIEPDGTEAIVPFQSFEISDLTIDCNLDNQPARPDPGYGNVACGAVRILGSGTRIRNVKAINWGTKSFAQGCFVVSIIQASARPMSGGHPIVTETQDNGIEDCICVQPSKNNVRETTVLHIGGLANSTNHAQCFGRAAFIRKNFVDCQFLASVADGVIPTAFPSAFLTSSNGTGIAENTGTFVGKRPHFRNNLDNFSYVRFYNPKNPASRWNGYFQVIPSTTEDNKFTVILGTAPPDTNDDSSFVIMGTEFRGIAMSSCIHGVVEQNQIHNCWIGGPYQSPFDDSAEFDPDVPPTLAREERLDPLNALHIRSLIVRDNHYRNVAVGPYFNPKVARATCPPRWATRPTERAGLAPRRTLSHFIAIQTCPAGRRTEQASRPCHPKSCDAMNREREFV